jgi:hypothetical protein
MSNSAINWARKIEGLTSPQAFVLWVICDRYNEETHTAWPSIKSVATDTRLAPRTVTRAPPSRRNSQRQIVGILARSLLCGKVAVL